MTDKPNTPDTDKETNEETKKASNKPVSKAKTAKHPVKKTTPPANTKKGNGIAWLALMLIIVLGAAGAYAYITIDKKIATVASTSANAAQQNKLAYSALSNSTQSTASALDKLTEKHQTLEKQSSEKISLLQRQIGKNKRQWLISEAEYVASVANTRLYLVGDVATAIAALQAADQRLKENGDPVVFPIREQIVREIASLKRVELPDIVGLSSQLLILEESVSQMEITKPHAGKVQAPKIASGDTSPIPENIQQTLTDAWSNFSKLVVVRRNDEPMAALMTPEQVELIRKNLALKIEAARLALIHKDKDLYSASLSITADWLAAYFDSKNTAVKVAIEQINKLKATSITAALPDISKSLKMLRDLPLTSLEPEPIQTPATIKKAVKQPKPAATSKKIEEPVSQEPVASEPVTATPEPTDTPTQPNEQTPTTPTAEKS